MVGLFVSLFAIIGGRCSTEELCGVVRRSPSIAFATLGIAWAQHGSHYAGIQARAMIFGGIALLCYIVAVCQILTRTRAGALTATLASFRSG